jgi:hypothetical protein
VGGDPNPGTAFRVIEECGCYQVMPGYHYFKQVSRAGQPGMRVAAVEGSGLIAFASNGTSNPDAFVVINQSQAERSLRIAVNGTATKRFTAFRTSLTESYASAGDHAVNAGAIVYNAPPSSVTTFYGAR